MAMVINNNAAMMVLGRLNKNLSKAGKDLKKVSTGMKINGAGDDASGYAISERMQVRIRSLNQNESNVNTGMSMLKVAAGGIESIIEELRSLKELAINAANDSNTDLDRATLQKEFDQRRENIDNIAVETNYNGKILLTGIYGNRDATVGSTGEVVHSGAVEPTGTPIKITSGNYTISQSGVYRLVDNSCNITIASGVHDVKFVGGWRRDNIHITGPADGNANIWIEGLDINNKDNSSFIKFQGTNNTLNIKGNNEIDITNPYGDHHPAIINVGGGLTVEGGVDGTGAITFRSEYNEGANIGSDFGEKITSPIIVNSGTYTSIVSGTRTGALVGSGADACIGDITINGGTFNDESVYGVTIGHSSTEAYHQGTECGNITIKNAVIKASNKDGYGSVGGGFTGISNGTYVAHGTCGDIYIGNSKIDIKSETGAGIGTGKGSACGNITVENSILSISSKTGAGIGSGENGNAGNITINNCDLTQVLSEQGENVGRGVNGTAGAVMINTGKMGAMDWQPLIVHDGTKANQSLKLYINDMRTSALKGKIADDLEDIDLLRNLKEDPIAYKEYVAILREAEGKTLDDVSVTTQHGASVAIRVIDGAIQYALDEATNVGAYISRLEYTAANIVTSNENTISSESTIRDADMAKEMTEYTKSNVLVQAAQSMLAQANQASANVIKLLQ